ncbi:MAG: NADH-quinone oxidoreductase subunit N [Polyangiaceae bacterium]|nr:NADH-quinone oxidoreductase subunit N [Polyangiaceae bacterium]
MQADLLALLPEGILTVAILAVLVIGARRGPWSGRKPWLTWLSTVALLGAGVALAFADPQDRSLFSGMVALDGIGLFFRGLFVVAGLGGVLMGALSTEIAEERLGEYLALLLSVTLGLMLLGSAQNLLMVYLALELVSIPSYVLAGFRRGNRESSEAALKYVLYGGVASGLMLYGFSLLYGLTGSLGFAELAEFIGRVQEGDTVTRVIVLLAGILSLAGFGYKVAAVPFHMWCPDVYQGAPTPFVAFLSVAPKAGGMAALIRFMTVGFGAGEAVVGTSPWPWAMVLAIVSVATMTLGNLVAIPQNNLKRLLAYSSIAHAGYMLMGVAVGTTQAIQAVMFYLGVYLAMNFGAFLIVMAVRDRTGHESIDNYRGLGGTSPVLAVALAIFLFSLTGLPPFAGFIGKFYLFAALLETQAPLFYVVAIIGVLNSAVSLYYYARVVKAMFLEKAEGAALAPGVTAAYAGLTAAFVGPTLLLGVWWAPLVETIERLGTVVR